MNIACSPEIRNGRDPNTTYQHGNSKAYDDHDGIFEKKASQQEKRSIYRENPQE